MLSCKIVHYYFVVMYFISFMRTTHYTLILLVSDAHITHSISDEFIIESIDAFFQMYVDIFYNNLVTIMFSMTDRCHVMSTNLLLLAVFISSTIGPDHKPYIIIHLHCILIFKYAPVLYVCKF